jgi:hypothetical protein
MRCLIVSAGYGVVRPDEPIHKYNLQMAQTLAIWKRRLPEILADYISRNGVKRVFGALSAKYYEAVADVQCRAPDVEFLWRVPSHPRGALGSAMQEVPKAVGYAVIDLIASDFKPDSQWSESPAGCGFSRQRVDVTGQSGGHGVKAPPADPKAIGGAAMLSKGTVGGTKYEPLQRHLGSLPVGEKRVWLTFRQLERIIGDKLPTSARKHRPWWANETTGSHVQAGAWRDVGWSVESIDIGAETVTFVRMRSAR